MTKAFCAVLRETRIGARDPATVNWAEFEPVLLRCHNAALQREGKAPWSQLRKPGAPAVPPTIEAYVAFLELERAELLWKGRYWDPLWDVQNWTLTLGNPALLRILEPLDITSPNDVQAWTKHFEHLKIVVRRARAAARKAKSRKKLRGKV